MQISALNANRRGKRNSLLMVFLIVVLSVLSLDQLSKFFLTKKLLLHESVPVIKGIFHLTLVHNRGAAFGLLKNQTYLFIFASLVAISLISFSLRQKESKKSFFYNLSLALILAGAIGNLIDRIVFGYVIDFLDFRVWPVFNIADSAITIGATLLAWKLIFNDKCQNSKSKINLKFK